MTYDEKIFSDICREYSWERYDPTHGDPDLLENQLLESERTRLNKLVQNYRNHLLNRIGPGSSRKIPEFYFDYVDSPKINARACFSQKTSSGIIFVNTGAVSLIYDVYYRMLSHPQILPTIGNASAESVRFPCHSEGLSTDYNVLLRSRGRGGRRLKQVAPKDPIRKAYAESLARDALEFLVIHEFAHIAFGHCQYANPKGLALMMESGKSKSKITPLVSQALELHADSNAALATWENRKRLSEAQRAKRAILETGGRIVIPDELLMFDWVFALFVMFWMLGQDIDLNSLATEAHPPPSQRAFSAMASVYGFVKKNDDKETQDQFERARINAFREGGDAINKICKGEFFSKIDTYLNRSLDGVLPNHLINVMATWKSIRPDVLMFSHFEPSN